MEEQATTERLPSTEVRSLSVGDPFFERVQEINDLIASRAYELFEAHGLTHGQDREDWLRAEAEILHPVPLVVIETETDLTVRAEMPGFSGKEIEVRVEPHHLFITGKRQEASEQARGKTVFSERQSNLVLRVLELPTNVDPDRVKAMLNNGVLEVTLPKVGIGKEISVLARAASA